MTLKLFVLFCLSALLALAQNPGCPGATGAIPHCVLVSWSAPTSGGTATGYNVYTGGTAAAQCATVSAPTCTKLTPTPISAAGPLSFTLNSSATVTLKEGSSYFYVVTAVNAGGESTPSAEVSALIPFLVPGPPTAPSASAK